MNSVLTFCVCVVSRVSSLSVSVRRPACPHCLCLRGVPCVLTVCVCEASCVSSPSVSVRRPACPHCLCLCTEVPGRAAGPAGERGAHQAARSGDPPRLSPQRRPLRQVLPHHHPDALGAGTTPHVEKILIL